jgi:CDP-diacylglycerol--serine O-phosphatidyltransferase
MVSMSSRRAQLLPNLITLANAFCGILALSKAIDALTLSAAAPIVFYEKMETACQLVFLGMVFDALDGLVARMTGGGSEFGAQLDSFSDALTFGVVPAILAKVLVEHESAGGSARLHFLAAASFSLMAILRLVRFNLEPEPPSERPPEGVKTFRGLPSPAAAGAVASTIWFYLILRRPELEVEEGTPTWMHRMLSFMREVDWAPLQERLPTILVGCLPLFGLLMVSNLRYVHGLSYLMSRGGQFVTLVLIVSSLILFYLAPVPILFLTAFTFVASGIVGAPLFWLRARTTRRTA